MHNKSFCAATRCFVLVERISNNLWRPLNSTTPHLKCTFLSEALTTPDLQHIDLDYCCSEQTVLTIKTPAQKVKKPRTFCGTP